jgi:hypothetical protein
MTEASTSISSIIFFVILSMEDKSSLSSSRPTTRRDPHQATWAPSDLRTEEQDWHGGAQDQGVEAAGREDL